MKPTLSAFKDSPDEGQGQARDMRVRWALEEVGQPYDVRLLTFEELEQPEYLALQPFGEIPIYQEPGLTLFETGAILLHLADTHAGLLPTEKNARARAITWMFAALNTIEPPIVDLERATLIEADEPWYRERVPALESRIREVLGDLSRFLGSRTWLLEEFNASDLLLVTVLRRLEGTGLLEESPSLQAYVARGTARPAYQRAFAAQKAVFEQRRQK